MTLLQYLQTYPPRPPKVPLQNLDEARLLLAADGVLIVDRAPMPPCPRGAPNSQGEAQARLLWVFRATPADIPAVQELGVVTPPLQSGKAKHTNLTGGQAASCGGELWVDPVDPKLLYVNGGSGRYGPDTPQALADAVRVFEDRGYTVKSFGWDDGGNRPARFYRDS